MYEEMEMRAVLANVLKETMATDERIVVIDADLRASMNTKLIENAYPERALNVGIAEQNMCSVAAGLSSYGFIPFIYSFAPFVTRRIADQLAVSVAYAKQNVKIVGTDPGVSAELNGGTHMSFEDVSILRAIPDIVIFEPVDAVQLEKAIPSILECEKPVYIRLFRKKQPLYHDADYNFRLGKADVLKEGKDITFVASGIMVAEADKAAKMLEKEGVSVEIVNVHTWKPIDRETIVASAKKTGKVVTCENHSLYGGLRSAVAEVLSEEYPVPMRSVGVDNKFGEVGKADYLKTVYGMTADDIVRKAKELLK